LYLGPVAAAVQQNDSMEHEGNLFLTGVNINTDNNVFKKPEEAKSDSDHALVVTRKDNKLDNGKISTLKLIYPVCYL
jgi:hypothetical protein